MFKITYIYKYCINFMVYNCISWYTAHYEEGMSINYQEHLWGLNPSLPCFGNSILLRVSESLRHVSSWTWCSCLCWTMHIVLVKNNSIILVILRDLFQPNLIGSTSNSIHCLPVAVYPTWFSSPTLWLEKLADNWNGSSKHSFCNLICC